MNWFNSSARTPLVVFMLLTCRAAAPALADGAMPDVTLEGHTSTLLDVAFSPDGKRLASVADDGKVILWDLATKKPAATIENAKGSSNQVRFTSDGKTLVSLSSDNGVLVLDVSAAAAAAAAHKPIVMPSNKGASSALDLSPAGKTVAVVGRGFLRLIDLTNGSVKKELEVHKSYSATAVAYSSDGKMIATTGTDHTALVLDAASGNVLHAFKTELNGTAVAFSRDGKTLIVATTAKMIVTFDIASGEPQTLLKGGLPYLSLRVSKDGKWLVVGGPGHGPWVISQPDGVREIPGFDSNDPCNAADMSPDGKWLAGGGNGGAVYLWKFGK